MNPEVLRILRAVRESERLANRRKKIIEGEVFGMKVTGLKIGSNIGKFDISDKARIMYAGDYVFDIIAVDTDTDRVYSFGFNYADQVLVSITDEYGEAIEGTMEPAKALEKLSRMAQNDLYEFDYRESDLIEVGGM